jgi:1-acyl-sn-glycerol-3-phosphate acyltransferase
MLKLKTLYHYFVGFFSISVVIIFFYIFPKKHRIIRKKWAQFQIKMLGAKLEISGTIDSEAKLFIINHRSMLDIIALEAIMPNDPCWVAKQEITDIAWFGRINDIPKMISINREDKKGLLKLLKETKQRIDEGRVIMIFPEGTRSKTDKFLPFKAGAKMVAEKHHLKVQPVVVCGTDKVLDTQTHTINCGVVKISFLNSFTPQRKTNWLEKTREKMQNEYHLLTTQHEDA